MSAGPPAIIQSEPPRIASTEHKPVERVTVRENAEIESIKRTLYNAIDKLDRLTAK